MSAEWITDTVVSYCIKDRITGFTAGEKCFLIGHHTISKGELRRITAMLADCRFSEYYIFGEHCTEWSEALGAIISPFGEVRECNKTDLRKMTGLLIESQKCEPKLTCCIVSDDYGFAEMLKYDLLKALSNEKPKPVRRFTDGIEFVYNDKDCIIQIGEKTIIGYLGRECVFETMEEAFEARIFDGKSFYDIYSIVSEQWQ